MSKPTKEVVELSAKLKRLGYEDDLHIGNWVSMEGNILLVTSREGYTFRLDGEDYYRKVTRQYFNSHDTNFLIPSLEDGLLWLEITFDHKIELYSDAHNLLYARDRGFWICDYLREKGCPKGKTPHEAVLMAMIKVLESQ